YARAREAGRDLHVPRIRRQPVDVVTRQARRLDGLHARVDRQLERVAEQPPADVGLAYAGDGRVERHDAPPDTGSKNGSHTSSYCSNTTCTGMPIDTSSGAQFTMLHVNRTDGSSSISTMATT